MENICSAFTSANDEAYDVFPVKRIGLEVDWFSQVMGRTVLHGHITYDSNKNYRSNKAFDQYKALNALRLKTIFILIEGDMPAALASSFMGDTELFLPPDTDKEVMEADVFMYATPAKHFKVFKSKRFFVKAFDVLYYERRPTGSPVHKVIQSCTLEVLCKLTD
jgi:hypothetical protein